MNRLAKETSPYLKQHQENPVDWYPWGEEALARARAENKPILLSIGYAACHWCHVMAHESFENEAIARLMNENFVCIKVDREERPDLDQVYQPVAQAVTGGGGWPLTVFLLPDGRPFFGGTYFPPEDAYGRPSFKRVLEALRDAFKSDPKGVESKAARFKEMLARVEQGPEWQKEWQKEWHKDGVSRLQDLTNDLVAQVDMEKGGFGNAPKFPNPMIFTFLWRMGHQEPVIHTLRKMAQGGIHDQLGGGFHRYSVDDSWSVPHFEKMLYDNGLLLKLYSEVLLKGNLSGDDRALFVATIEGMVEFLLRDLRTEDGVFCSSLDADSEGEEGRYYSWTREELEALLPRDELRVAGLHFGFTEQGQMEGGRTVLRQALSLDALAEVTEKSKAEVAGLVSTARQKMLAARKMRVAPARDAKVLVSWNGLAISGLAWAAMALRGEGRPEGAGKVAQEVFAFLAGRLSKNGDRLWGSWQEGKPKLQGNLEDYAFLAMAALDLARIEASDSEREKLLAQATVWSRVIVKHFRDPASAGYFLTADDPEAHDTLIQRPKSVFDQAIPSASAVAVECLCALSEILGAEEGGRFDDEVRLQLASLLPLYQRAAAGCAEGLNAVLLASLGSFAASGPGAEGLAGIPFVFRKVPEAGSEGKFLVCHRQSCREFAANSPEALGWVREFQPGAPPVSASK